MKATIKKKVGFLAHVQVNPLFGPSSSLRSMLSLEHFTLELYGSMITQVLPCAENISAFLGASINFSIYKFRIKFIILEISVASKI